MNKQNIEELLEHFKKSQHILNELQVQLGEIGFKFPKPAEHMSEGEAEQHSGDNSCVDDEQQPELHQPFYIDEYSEESIKLGSDDLQVLDLHSLEQVADREQAKEPCSICFLTYAEFPQEPIRELPCAHLFHMSCVDVWLKDKGKCPKCKFDVRDYV